MMMMMMIDDDDDDDDDDWQWLGTPCQESKFESFPDIRPSSLDRLWVTGRVMSKELLEMDVV